MSRTLARRGASVLVAAAVLGGVVGFGGGTASAEASSVSYPGGSAVIEFGLLFALSGVDSVLGAGGSVEPGNVWTGCGNCPPAGTPIGSIAWDDWLNGRPPGTSMPPQVG